MIFAELRPDHPDVQMADGSLMDSDVFFAQQMRHASNVILAATTEINVPALFATNALAVGDISTDKDPDGVLRRAKAFRIYRKWHPLFRKVEDDREFGVDLERARIEPGQIILPRTNAEAIKVPVDAQTNFALADFVGDKLPPGVAPKARAFTDERVWHFGLVLAARELNLDLANADVDLAHGRITLRGPIGVERVIPVDSEGYFYIDWRIKPNDAQIEREPVYRLLARYKERLEGKLDDTRKPWNGKLVVVGASAQGNDLTDRGATPLERDTLLSSQHLNVANSIITGRFVRRASLGTELALIVLLGALTAFLTWQLRAFSASAAVVLMVADYCVAGLFLYVKYCYWLPLVLPIVGAMFVEHVSLVTYRVVFEEKERRRIKSVFAKIVSPNVVNELLEAETVSLGGARRDVTVLFADVRGFTELTDVTQERVAEFVREHHLPPEVAETCFDEFATETLNTVSLYLSCVADAVIKQNGTLDKYIGDCVMAFWGAPTPHAQHALACVRAAIEAQRAINELNRQRAAENDKRELENRARASAGLPPKLPFATLTLGTGINTGSVTVGLMGSDAHFLNYTVFGREVNLASRLEGIAGRGRILISETTYQHLWRDDPVLAATCIELPPATLKGIRDAVKIYEVPGRLPGDTADTAAQTTFFSQTAFIPKSEG